MKNLTCWMIALLLCSAPWMNVNATTLPEDEPVLVYYMPLTQLLLTAEYDEVVTEVGQFYQYSERYLGTKDVITKADRQFVLKNVTFATMASADTTRQFIISDKSGKTQLVSLSPWGTLAGYNILLDTPKPGDKHKKPCDKNKCETLVGTETTHLMPLLEEQLMASSTAKMAEGAAKQIYRIREMRLNLLAGEVDKYPADGAALRQILQELDKREQDLTALFVGRRTIVHHVQRFTYTPTTTPVSNEESILFRFSRHYGVVATDDLSGEPVTIRLNKNMHAIVKPEKQAQKIPTLYYNLPGNGELIVNYGDNELLSHPVEVAQWGVSVPVNSALLNMSTHITFNPQTGAIVSIEK